MNLTTIEPDTLVTFRLQFRGKYLSYNDGCKGWEVFGAVDDVVNSILFFVIMRGSNVFILGGNNTNDILELINYLSENTSDDEFFRQLYRKNEFVKVFIILRYENGNCCMKFNGKRAFVEYWRLDVQLSEKEKELVFEWVYSAPYPMIQTIRQPLQVVMFEQLHHILK